MTASTPSPIEQSGDAFRALRRAIVRSRGFSLQLCTCDSLITRDRLIENLDASLPGTTVHRIELPDPDELDPIDAVAELRPPGPVMIVGLETQLADEKRAERLSNALNLSRGDWPRRVPVAVVIWLPRRLLGRLTASAPDFFDWRSDTLDFPELTTDQTRTFAPRDWQWGIDPRLTREEQDERVQELQARLATTGDSDDERICRHRLEWWDELAELKRVRGDLDEALRIRTEEEIPIFERLGDLRSKAVTQGQIADILQARGNLDEALRIRTEEQLPVFKRLGDLREKAITQGKIADILQARGNLDEALRIRTEEQLPVFKRLGDLRSKAVTQGKIADILQARGNLDEALRIRTEEEIPVYERLGDVREKAITQGKIADILQARGNLDEALALHETRLSVYEDLQDIDGIAHARFAMAGIRLQRGDHQNQGLQDIHDDLAQAFVILRQLQRLDGIGAVGMLLAQVLAMGGHPDKALEILDQAQAAFDKLGNATAAEQTRQLRQHLTTPS